MSEQELNQEELKENHCCDKCDCDNDEKQHNCSCGDDCEKDKCCCDEDCSCHQNEGKCHCDENCSCHNEDEKCHCDEGGECSCDKDKCDCKNCTCDEKVDDAKELAGQYLNLAKQVQADFENFRRHALEDIKQAKINGQISVIEIFLPCLDTFKEAKKSITDENILKGVEMIESKITDALKSLGVEKIDSIGQVYNPHLHNVIAVMNDQEKDNDIILDEYQAGYKFNDKVIRYAKVIVNKKEDK